MFGVGSLGELIQMPQQLLALLRRLIEPISNLLSYFMWDGARAMWRKRRKSSERSELCTNARSWDRPLR